MNKDISQRAIRSSGVVFYTNGTPFCGHRFTVAGTAAVIAELLYDTRFRRNEGSAGL